MTQEAIQRVLWTLRVVLPLALGALGARYLPRAPDGPPPITSIVAMSHLVSVKVRYADIVTFTQQRTLDIPWTDWKVKYAGTRVVLFVNGRPTWTGSRHPRLTTPA
jgi:hypothetical protein